MDKRDILPGEVWKSSIQAAIRRSDFFLACLSANSITKRGYLQKEIRDALNIWQEMLENDIYLIPVRMEDCEVPEGLRQFQWVDLFQVDGWTQLVKAIQVGMERRKDITEPATRESMLSELHPVHANSSASIQGSDIYSSYEAGLDRLLSQMRRDHPGYSEALTYQQRLIENIARSRQYGDTEIYQSNRAEIIAQLNRIALQELGMSFDEVCRPSTPTTRDERTGPGEDDMSRVRFVNREYELRRICTLNGAQFILIDAPAGYGKSHLLLEIRRQLCGLSGKPPEKPREDHPHIRGALVEFGDRLALERQVLDAICQQLDISPDSVASADNLAPEIVAIADQSEGPNHRLTTVVLIFDNIDQIPIERVKTWLLRDLITGLDKGLDATKSGVKLRAILAGRFIAGEWDALGKQHGLKFTLLPLSPFSRDIVEEALRLKAKDVGRSLDPPACSAMARGIVRVTGGHPRCMSQVIDRIARMKFSIHYEGPGNYFDRIHDGVFRDSVKQVIDELMKKLDDKVSDLLWQISVFRRFDQRVVNILFNSGEIEGFNSSDEAFASLTATTLITPPDSIETFHTDRIVRRLLMMAMEGENPGLCSRLNLIALHVFRAWLDGKNIEAVPRDDPTRYAGELPNRPKDQLQVALAQEYLYHYLWSIETLNEKALEREAKRLHDDLDSSLGAYDIPNQRRRMRDALNDDWELEDRIYYLAGGEEAGGALWERLLGWACGPAS